MSKTYLQEVTAQSSEPVEAHVKNAWQCNKITYESYVKNLKKKFNYKIKYIIIFKKKIETY